MRIISVVMFVLFATSAYAQSRYPGTVWSSNGTLSPFESGNILSQTHVEQGVAVRGFEVFGQFTFAADSKAYDWNRHYGGGLGLRLTQSVKSGMIRASVSYVRDYRYLSRTSATGLVFAAETWFGWQNSPRPAKLQ